MALIKLEGNMSPFRQALKVLSDVGFNKLEVDAPGQEEKVKAADRRKDEIPQKVVHAGIQEGLEETWSEKMRPAKVRAAVEKSVKVAVRDAILFGYVKPGRRRKTKNRTGKPLYDTGELARAVRAKASK